MDTLNPITMVFIAVMAAVYGLSPKQFRRNNTLPTLLTTIGILGTFVGITKGLIDFDVNNVQASVPSLLEGLKIAFLTSIVGISAAILIRIKNIYRTHHDSQTPATTEERALELLDQIRSEQSRSTEDLSLQIRALRESFVGSGESTLITQLQKIRTTIIDKTDEQLEFDATIKTILLDTHNLLSHSQNSTIDCIRHLESTVTGTTNELKASIGVQFERLDAFYQLIASNMTDATAKICGSIEEIATESKAQFEVLHEHLNVFAVQLAENNTKVFIAALEQAIRDFNAHLTEQFGENFRHLNEAVGKLLEWQELYRQQMAGLVDSFNDSVASLESAGSDLKNIATELGATVELMDELNTFVEATKLHVAQLKASLEAHSALAEEARTAFPTIREGIEELSGGFLTHVDNMNAATERNAAILRSTVDEQATLMSEYSRAMSEAATKHFTNLDRRVDENFQCSTDFLVDRLEKLDEALEDELIKSLNSLGNQLVSLSSQFVKDYTPLTERLREIVRIAEGVDDAE